MIVLAANYGPLAQVVSGAGAAIAATGAIGLAWRGRARWEPAEAYLPKGPEKVGGLAAAVIIVFIWLTNRNTSALAGLGQLALAAGGLAVVALMVYIYLIGIQTYEIEVAVTSRRTERRKIIGGFRLTEVAKAAQRKHGVPVQQLLKGMAYNPDAVWTRPSRSLTNVAFTLCYLTLTVAGTVALACAGIILTASQLSH